MHIIKIFCFLSTNTTHFSFLFAFSFHTCCLKFFSLVFCKVHQLRKNSLKSTLRLQKKCTPTKKKIQTKFLNFWKKSVRKFKKLKNFIIWRNCESFCVHIWRKCQSFLKNYILNAANLLKWHLFWFFSPFILGVHFICELSVLYCEFFWSWFTLQFT